MPRQSLTNDTATLTPKTSFTGRRLEFEFPALLIGIAEYEEGPTGCSVFLFPEAAAVALDVRGGSVGYVGDYGWAHAICLAGGSIYGLEAVSGVAAELFAEHGHATGFNELALVTGGIVYDFHDRGNAIYPDKALGRAAVRAARGGHFPLGARGAGAYVNVGNGPNRDRAEQAGQGGAFAQFGETKVAVFTVVNAIGAIVDRSGTVIRGHLDRASGRRHHLAEIVDQGRSSERDSGPVTTNTNTNTNTTLTVVVTNRVLDEPSLRQFGRQVHSSMARAIQPFHTVYDGDLLWSVTTGEVEEAVPNVVSLGAIASELAWDAVLSCVPG